MFLATPADAAVLIVPAEYATIQAAVDVAEDDDIIAISSGDYSGEGIIDLDGKDLVFEGADPSTTTICGFTGTDVSLQISAVRLPCVDGLITVDGDFSDVTLTNVEASGCRGIGTLIDVMGDLTVDSVTIQDMETVGGGVILARQGDHEIVNSTFTDVVSLSPSDDCDPLVEFCSRGAALQMLYTNSTITDSVFDGCTADLGGCAVLWPQHDEDPSFGGVLVTNSLFTNAVGDIGAALLVRDFDTLNMVGVDFIDNIADTSVLEASTADADIEIDVYVDIVRSRFQGNALTADVEGSTFVFRAKELDVATDEELALKESWFCGNANPGGPSDVMVEQVDDIELTGVALALGEGHSSVHLVETSGLFRNVTIAGHTGAGIYSDPTLFLQGVVLNSSLFVDLTGEATESASSLFSGSYLGEYLTNGWSTTQPDEAFNAFAVEEDPLFQSYIDRVTTDCDTISLWLDPDSPMRDAGDPALGTDRDGSDLDIGAFGGMNAWLVDLDADGWYEDLDCNDDEWGIHPGAAETPYDEVDDDCDGADLTDADGDGEDSDIVGGPDCDDDDPAINTSAEEIWYDGIDRNCDGWDDYDQDQDGDAAVEFKGGDCDDHDPEVHSNADDEWYDGFDTNCDGADDFDQDGDGFRSDVYGGIDCDDLDPNIGPLADEIWYDGIDQDCNENDDDQDWDGFSIDDDCDDEDQLVNPDAIDASDDGIDQNCDGFDGPIGPKDTEDPNGGCLCSASGGPPGSTVLWAPLVLTMALRRRRMH